ncbi:choline kinase family protein [Mycolicibacterium sp. P1-5]|uniref:choline kinase family protein n=1 Tax=Mycolicibacterium sp. P1-5 TaxID=2024617 RepID=UPI0011ECEF84|nr:choline kinase family protein [Mycolicibacterium sp. P1-5]KAA0110069.1 LPS biosynthesis choline kinase [Mycolicibacterium sp. P1-5]
MPFTSDPELDALLDQLPALAGQPRQLEELHGGLTNRNIKITTPAATYVARCTVNATNMLGIDRDNEYYNSRAAEEAGVGAPVIDYRPDLGILLVGFLEGNTLTNADLQRPDVLARVADGCRTLHAGPRFRDRFNMFERQPAYLKVVQERGFRIPTDYLYFTREFQAVKRILGPDEHATVPCNNDLLAGNFVDNGSKVWLIDYEYSGNNDPCFELGNIWAECGLSIDQLDELVTLYYGRRLRHKTARARLQGIVGKYGWTLWGCIQNATSTLDFDFWEWAMERYESAVAEFRGPGFPRLLADAQAPD